MARFNAPVDFDNVDENAGRSFGLLPFGDYVLEVVSIEAKPNGSKTDHSYTYEVIEPADYKGRRIFDWICVQSDEDWQVNNGLARMKRLAIAVGYDFKASGPIEDDDVLLYSSFLARVIQAPGGTSRAGKAFKESNKVDEFYDPQAPDCPEGPSILDPQPAMAAAISKATNDNTPARTAPAQRTAQPAAATAKPAGSRPWGNKRAA